MRTGRLRSSIQIRNPMWMLFLSCGLVFFQPPSGFTQAIGPDAGKGRISEQGELQRNPKEERMDPARPAAAVPIDGEIVEMEKHLARPVGALTLNRQAEVDPLQAANPPHGSGDQTRPPAVAQAAVPGEAHLNLVLRLKESGGVEVLSATEVPGEAVISDVPIGSFVCEVTSDRGILAVEAIQDPFEIRSFPGAPGTPTQGHHIERAASATITVKVPKTNLASAALDKVKVQIHSIKAGPPIDQINSAVFQKLGEEKRLELRWTLSAADLAQQVREKGRRLAPAQ